MRLRIERTETKPEELYRVVSEENPHTGIGSKVLMVYIPATKSNAALVASAVNCFGTDITETSEKKTWAENELRRVLDHVSPNTAIRMIQRIACGK